VRSWRLTVRSEKQESRDKIGEIWKIEVPKFKEEILKDKSLETKMKKIRLKPALDK